MRNVFMDPYNDVELPTNNGMLGTPKAVVLGHELGHAIGTSDDGPMQMNNVFTNPTGLDATITIISDTYTNNSITGTISVTRAVTNSTFSGYSLEQLTLDNANLPVSPGTYPAFRRTDHTLNRIELRGVNGATNAQIQNGNDINDVERCFAAGKSRLVDFVGSSVDAMNEINAILNADGGSITVIVVGGTAP